MRRQRGDTANWGYEVGLIALTMALWTPSPSEVEHLVGHVESVGQAGRTDPLGGQQHVDPASGVGSSGGVGVIIAGSM